MKLHFILLMTACLVPVSVKSNHPDKAKPRLIVGIVVDQMRYDYLTRYWNKFGENGFKKLVREGMNCSNTHYNYVPTYTGPGHASIYTGATPSAHGIISNDWYNRSMGKSIYVTEDPSAKSVGTPSAAGKMSPVHLLTTTLSDEIRLASNLRSKVIGIALKDRGAILPAGHAANAAYWFDDVTGNWITSDWYMPSLPGWVTSFNDRKLADSYLKQPWTTLLPIAQYVESTADDTPYEDPFPGETRPVFPHAPNTSTAMNYALIRKMPQGNTLTTDFSIAAMHAEQLGTDAFTDVLAVSYSPPDYVGHQFGTHAVETQDVYLRLDLELERLIGAVEKYAGKENVLFFLTADHAAIPNVLFLNDQQIPAGTFNIAGVADSLNTFLSKKYGPRKWVLAFDNDQVYLDHELAEKNNLDIKEMSESVAAFLLRFKGVAGTLTSFDLLKNEYTFGIRSHIQKGFYHSRSGDVVLIPEPGWIEYKSTGTTHGSGYTYDNHVPLIFYGWNIKPGSTSRHIYITDIAPTLSQLLGIQSPSGSTGMAIPEVTDN